MGQEAKGLSGEGILRFNTSAESTPRGKGKSREASREAAAIAQVRDDNPRGPAANNHGGEIGQIPALFLRLAGFTDG